MIKFDEIIKEKEYRERVIKYFKLPMRLSVSEEKFLSDFEFLKEIDSKQYEMIISCTEKDFNKIAKEQDTSTPDFTMENILEPIIQSFEVNPRWLAFLKQDYSDVLNGYKGITNTHGFYKEENNGKHFISIDLKAANWQSLQSIMGFNDSYEELIVKHTDNLIPPISKTFRTKITGILGAKQIMDYNKYLLKSNKDAILQALYNITKIDLREQEPFAFYADEFLIEINEELKDKLNIIDLNKLEEYIYNETYIKVHITPFTLKWLNIEKGCVKLYKNNNYEIINLSKDILLIMNKLINDKPIKDIDFEGIKLKGKSQEEYINKLSKIVTTIIIP